MSTALAVFCVRAKPYRGSQCLVGKATRPKQDVNEMRVVDLRIEDVGFGGKGVAREQGKAVFVPYTIESEIVCAEIVREKKQFAEAELLEMKETSPHRVTPECPYFGRCGGCAYQHIGYEHQLAIKW